MNNVQRAFLIIEGQNDSYPNHETARVYITVKDPSQVKLASSFVCSPIFPFATDGVNLIPEFNVNLTISFLIVPNVYPTFNYLKENYGSGNELWFSLGLSNLIIIEQPGASLATDIISYLQAEGNITAYETWQVVSGNVIKEETRRFKFFMDNTESFDINIPLSDQLPGHLNFAVSEYIISVNKFLTASKKFTPHYFRKHLSTINASKLFINDLCFLCGDLNFEPSSSLIDTLGVSSKEEAIAVITDTAHNKTKEELINVKHSMIVQFNSSMSYIYTQAYSGVFPLFDHHGIVRRYSLLGIGTAVSALFELIIQIEESVYSVPFESFENTSYDVEHIPNTEYFKHFVQPSPFDVTTWQDDNVRKRETDQTLVIRPPSSENGFFHRLSFFSGRLGFREHEFCATSAIQVLVDGHSLRWNIINYTHEVIHNHVRIILNNILVPQNSVNDNSYTVWVDKYRALLRTVIMSQPYNKMTNVTYSDYFTLCLFNFAAFSNFYGSLNRPCNTAAITKIRAATGSKKVELQLVTCDQLKELLQNVHRDITEIFVHIIDYCYI